MQHATVTNTITSIFIVMIMTIVSLVGSYGITYAPVRPNRRHSVNPLPFPSFWTEKLDYNAFMICPGYRVLDWFVVEL